jgi:hypothetical protein
MCDKSPETHYPHEIVIMIIAAPIVLFTILFFVPLIAANIRNALPKKQRPKYAQYIRWV